MGRERHSERGMRKRERDTDWRKGEKKRDGIRFREGGMERVRGKEEREGDGEREYERS